MTFQDYVKRPAWLSLAAAVLLVVAGLVWWQFVYQSPVRAFNDMLGNNLTTASVTKHISGKRTGETIDEYARLQLGSTDATNWLVSVTQGSSSKVVTESVGTPGVGYVRYLNIDTNKKTAAGKLYDFSKTLNIWARANLETNQTIGGLFDQTLLSVNNAPVLPLGNLSADHRYVLLKFIRDNQVLTPDYKTVTTATENGRAVYVYSVSVKLEQYVQFVQAFAKDVGVHSLDNINPASYANSPPLTLQLSVDRRSHNLLRLGFPAGNFIETYSDYGLLKPIVVPKASIPLAELQARLSAVK